MGAEKTWYGRVDWCRGCMPMSGAMLVKGSSEEFEGLCSPRLGTLPAALHRCA